MAGTALSAKDALMPRPLGGQWPGVALSMLAHVLLFAALMWGVRWAPPQTDTVAAELWAAVPQAAAPPPAPAPAPTPPAPEPKRPLPTPAAQPDADIALEKARKAKAEQDRQQKERAEKERAEKDARDKRQKEERDRRERAEKDAKAKAETERREKAAADERLAKQREENLARMMGQLGGSNTTRSATGAGTAAANAAPSASYAGRLIQAIKPNIVFAENLSGNPAAEVEVRAGPGGTILGRTLVKSSGSPEWDEAVLRAIDRTGSLPRDVDGRVPPRLTITFRPRD